MPFRDQGQSDSSKAAFDLSLLPLPGREEDELGGMERSSFKVRGCPGSGLAGVPVFLC